MQRTSARRGELILTEISLQADFPLLPPEEGLSTTGTNSRKPWGEWKSSRSDWAEDWSRKLSARLDKESLCEGYKK